MSCSGAGSPGAQESEEVRTVAERLCEALTLGRLGLVDAWRRTAINGVAGAVDATTPVLGGRKRNQTAAVGLIAGGAGVNDPALRALLDELEDEGEDEGEDMQE